MPRDEIRLRIKMMEKRIVAHKVRIEHHIRELVLDECELRELKDELDDA